LSLIFSPKVAKAEFFAEPFQREQRCEPFPERYCFFEGGGKHRMIPPHGRRLRGELVFSPRSADGFQVVPGEQWRAAVAQIPQDARLVFFFTNLAKQRCRLAHDLIVGAELNFTNQY
jgi:hypothetical protein